MLQIIAWSCLGILTLEVALAEFVFKVGADLYFVLPVMLLGIALIYIDKDLKLLKKKL